MARMRTIKPEAFSSDSLAECSVPARWTFAGLWTICDDDGYAKYDPRLVKSSVYPLDDQITASVVDQHLAELEQVGCVCFYTVAGRRFVHVPEFGTHQHPNRKLSSKLPQCPKEVHGSDSSISTECSTEPQRSEDAVSTHGGLTPVVVGESRGVGEVEEASQSARPSTALALPADTTQGLVGRWLEHCRERPPGRVVGQVSKHVKELLDEGIDPSHVERGLAQWAAKGLNPATLPSVVNEVMNSRPIGRPATTDSRAAAALELSQRLKASGE